ncbi:MAG: winged helix-turn-helix domain-containing protein [Petrotogales bacterium]
MLFKHKRSETEIIHSILSLAQSGAKKTHIMYKTNMSYNLFIEYLDFLLEKNLVERKMPNPSDGTIYKITEKGRKLLESINSALECLE